MAVERRLWFHRRGCVIDRFLFISCNWFDVTIDRSDFGQMRESSGTMPWGWSLPIATNSDRRNAITEFDCQQYAHLLRGGPLLVQISSPNHANHASVDRRYAMIDEYVSACMEELRKGLAFWRFVMSMDADNSPRSFVLSEVDITRREVGERLALQSASSTTIGRRPNRPAITACVHARALCSRPTAMRSLLAIVALSVVGRGLAQSIAASASNLCWIA